MNINEVILKIKNFNNCELDEPKGIPKIFGLMSISCTQKVEHIGCIYSNKKQEVYSINKIK